MAFNRDFDRRYQVTRMNGGSSDRRYTRDKNGRVTGITNVRPPSLAGLNATLDYAAENNRLQSVIGANAGTYIYDANGNTLSDGRHAFTYDALNRLTAVSANNTVLGTYTYDAWNRRTSKTAGGRTIHYHYDQDSRLIGESLANGTVLREYVYLRGEPVALLEYETRPGWYFYVTDHLGTPQQLVDSRGAVVWQAACLPYGETKVLKAAVQNNLRFPGQYFDAETSLHYNWNRYYNPKTGRYITADPIGLAGGMNLYAYAGGNPVNAVDLEGLSKGTNPFSGDDPLVQNLKNAIPKGQDSPEFKAAMKAIKDQLADPTTKAARKDILKAALKIAKAPTKYAIKYGVKFFSSVFAAIFDLILIDELNADEMDFYALQLIYEEMEKMKNNTCE